MDENVSKAVAAANAAMVGCGDTEGVRQWQTIRARLVELEAENERLRDWKLSYELLRREMTAERDNLQSRLAAADALLRDIAACAWFQREAPATVELIEAAFRRADMGERVPWDEYEDDADGWCDCNAMHTIEEIDSGLCDCCGKPISPEEYS